MTIIQKAPLEALGVAALSSEGKNATSKTEGDSKAKMAPAPKAQKGWRAKWQAKQNRYAEDAKVHQRRIAALALEDSDEKPDLEALYICGLEKNVQVRTFKERDVSHWASLVPTGLFSASYMEGMTLVKTPKRPPMGTMQFALPTRVLHVPMDIPENAVVEIGRRDRRCLVSVRYSEKGVFPILLNHIPVRLMQNEDTVEDAIVDVKLHRDGTLSIDTIEGALKIDRAAVYDHETAARSLQMHYSGAALLKKIR